MGGRLHAMGWTHGRARRVLALLVTTLIFVSSVRAATNVSGVLLQDTQWTLENSPYQVTGDVYIQSFATLTIHAGVTVRFEPGTNLIVERGALRALGTDLLPIVMSSYRDISGSTPAAGDWGQLRFLDEASDSATLLEHVDVRYGKGLVMRSASPRLNYVRITGHQGPAVDIDLKSSPAGVGNSAENNTLNGVVVPAGDILSDVTWGLQGLTYIVREGIVSIGQTPVIAAMIPAQVHQGESIDVVLQGSRLDAAESVLFDNPGISAEIIASSATRVDLRLRVDASASLGHSGLRAQVAAGAVGFSDAVTVLAARPPLTVASIEPTRLLRGETKLFRITGTELTDARVRVVAAGVGLTLSGLQTTATTATFNLTASSTAALGKQSLSVSRSGGSQNVFVDVTVDRAPLKLTVAPAPIAIPPDAVARNIAIQLSEPDSVDHEISLIVLNNAVATITPAMITLPAGQRSVPVQIKGLTVGQTVLRLSSTGFDSVDIPVIVTSDFAGVNTSYAALVGVIHGEQDPPLPHSVSVDLRNRVGVVVGSHVAAVEPRAISQASVAVPIVFTGMGLNEANSMVMIPPDGVTVGPLSPSTDGRTLSVPITVEAGAMPTPRQVILKTGQGTLIPATTVDAEYLYIVRPLPEIRSIEPIVGARGAAGGSFIVHGRNLNQTSNVSAIPATGLTFGANPIVSSDGSTVTATLSIAADAPLGERAIRVHTPSGVTTEAASVANTFTVVNAIEQVFTPISAPLLHVVKGEPDTPASSPRALYAAPVTISVGAVITGMQPAAGEAGTQFVLTVSGVDLTGVTTVRFQPDAGITVAAPVVAADGRSLTSQITLAADVPKTQRLVTVLNGTAPVPVANPDHAVFLITGPQPRITGISPIYLEVGRPTIALEVYGQNLTNAQRVEMIPATGMTVGTNLTTNSEGTRLTVPISAASAAPLGPRLVVVTTAAGSTSSTLGLANTLTLTDNAGTMISPVAASTLGVVKSEVVSTPPISRSAFASHLGVLVIEQPPPTTLTHSFHASTLGIINGPAITEMSPQGLVRGTTSTLVVRGYGLNAVTHVDIYPAEGVTLGAIVANAEGTELTLPITVSSTALLDSRVLRANTAEGVVESTDASVTQVWLAAGGPRLDSISPNAGQKGQMLTLTLRGVNLQNARVTAAPNAGLQFDTPPLVNAAGTEVTVRVSIAADAAATARVIQVQTPGGISSGAATVSNSFSVYGP